MEPIALTRASQLIHITDTLERLGESAEAMLGQAKLPMWHFCDPDDLIPAHHIYVLMEHAARTLGNSTFGLLVGTDSSRATMGTFGRLFANSLTPYHSFKMSCRLLPLHTSTARIWLTEAADEVWFCRSQFRGHQVGRGQMEQYVLLRLIEHVSLAAGSAWRPAKIRLQSQKTPARELRVALGDPEIQIGQKITAIAVPRALLAQPINQRNGTPGEVSQAQQMRFVRSAPASCFVDSLRQLALTMLKEGPPQIETMAEIAGLSVRSLQRRLANIGLSYFQIVDQARYQAATRLLEDSKIRITDIAMDVGYADSAHFTRAFKRWAGVTPREYRGYQLVN